MRAGCPVSSSGAICVTVRYRLEFHCLPVLGCYFVVELEQRFLDVWACAAEVWKKEQSTASNSLKP